MSKMPVIIGKLVWRFELEHRREFGVIVAQFRPEATGRGVRIKVLWPRDWDWENDLIHGFVIDQEMFAAGDSVLNQMLVDEEK